MFTNLFAGAVVGTIPAPKALAAALKLPKNTVDFLEVRVDAFAALPGAALATLEKSLPRLKSPLILTVRHPLEGGVGRLSLAQRRALFQRFLPHASLLDVELRSAAALRALTSEARENGVGLILSHHDFRKTPSLDRLHALQHEAAREGCDVFKLATVTRTASDLAILLQLLAARRGAAAPQLAVMGMGQFGKISRLTLGRSGSVLNYGYLDTAQVPGQWPAGLLKERLRECQGE